MSGKYEVVDTETGRVLDGPFPSVSRAIRAADGHESSYPGRVAVYDKEKDSFIDVDTGEYMDNPGEKGIRRYGPGKFDTVVDSYVYGAIGDVAPDEEVGDSQDFGWYGMLRFKPGELLELVEEMLDGQGAYERQSGRTRDKGPSDELTDEEADLLDYSVGVIMTEDSQGFVHIDYYEDETELAADWKKLQAEAEEFYAEAGEE